MTHITITHGSIIGYETNENAEWKKWRIIIKLLIEIKSETCTAPRIMLYTHSQ